MKKKKLKKRIKELEKSVSLLRRKVYFPEKSCELCENYKVKTITFKRWKPLPAMEETQLER